MRVLVVKSAFKDYQKGSVISDEADVTEILAGPQKVHVVVSEHEDAPAPVSTSPVIPPQIAVAPKADAHKE